MYLLLLLMFAVTRIVKVDPSAKGLETEAEVKLFDTSKLTEGSTKGPLSTLTSSIMVPDNEPCSYSAKSTEMLKPV